MLIITNRDSRMTVPICIGQNYLLSGARVLSRVWILSKHIIPALVMRCSNKVYYITDPAG